MIHKSNLLLLLLFALTVCAVGWLGYQLASQQDQQLKLKQVTQSEQTLSLIQNNINEYIKNHQTQLASLSVNDLTAFENSLKNDPLIHDILIFDLNNTLIFPQQITQEQQTSSYLWLQNIADTGERNLMDGIKSGWFIWYEQQKEKYIYWLKNEERIAFIALNNSMFMADFIYWLSTQPSISNQAHLMIHDNQGRLFYQWGDNSLMNADINVQKNLSSPLTGWSLNYLSKTDSLSSLSKGLFQLVLIGFLVLVSIITYTLYQVKRREQLEAQQRLSFINQVSHELKTPLTNIRLHGELLERTSKTSGNSSQSIAIIKNESERLTRLINNILNFNSVNNESFKIHCNDIEFDDLLEQSIQPFKPSFEQLNIEIKLENQIHQLVHVDSDLVKQVIGNLLSNIEKYAASSEQIIIHTQINSGLIEITIKDQGPGIKNKYHEKIFSPFYRINSDLTHASGSGLGLGLARDLARLHGGDLRLLPGDSGSCFQLTIVENHA